jgi:hypothetical protein
VKLILPDNIERVVPSWFREQLRNLDPNLIVYFNPMRQRWVIDRCTRNGAMSAALHEHTPECPRTNVTVVEEEGQYMPLCQQVIDDLRARDAWSQYGSFEVYDRLTQNAADEDAAKRETAIDDLYRHTTADNRAQLAKAWTLFSRHDMSRIH